MVLQDFLKWMKEEHPQISAAVMAAETGLSAGWIKKVASGGARRWPEPDLCRRLLARYSEEWDAFLRANSSARQEVREHFSWVLAAVPRLRVTAPFGQPGMIVEDDDWPTRHLCMLIDRLPDRVREHMPQAEISLALSTASQHVSLHTTEDLQQRIGEFVTGGIDQQLMVMGLVVFLESRLAHWADPGPVEHRRRELADTLTHIQDMREQPELTRALPIADSELDAVIENAPASPLMESEEEEERYRRQVQQALGAFRAEASQYFSPVYWLLYRERRRRHLTKSLRFHRLAFGDMPPGADFPEPRE